jgi:hypothetical protein
MKYRELLRIITSAGAQLVRHGARHDIYQNPRTGKKEQVPWQFRWRVIASLFGRRKNCTGGNRSARAIIKSLTQ